jgi:imidazolonepropionase-like amidohydrolase
VRDSVANAKRLMELGVSVHIGAHGQREGLGSHWEMWGFVLGGMSPMQALQTATINPARYMGFDRDLGSIESGKLADLALWRLDGVDHAGIEDPVAALVLGPQPVLKLLLVGGRTVVADGELRTTPQLDLARELRAASTSLIEVAR